MNRYFCVALAGVLLLANAPVRAEKIDCESMAQLGAALDQISEGLANGEEVDEETDQGLADVIESLRSVALEEENANFDSAIDGLEEAWHNDDRAGYIAALGEVDAMLGAFYTTDCG